MNYLNGEGTVIIKAYSDYARTALVTTVTMPLCEKGGYNELWIPERFSHNLISLDITSPSVEQRDFVTGYWGIWDLNWGNLLIDRDIWLELAQILNGLREGARTKYYLTITPRSDYSFADRIFAVNYIGDGLEILRGVQWDKGLRLKFKTIRTQSITIVAPDDPDTAYYTYGDEGFEEVLYET